MSHCEGRRSVDVRLTTSQDSTVGGMSLTATRASTTVLPSGSCRTQRATRGRRCFWGAAAKRSRSALAGSCS